MHALLSKAEDLHMSALKLAMETFGEKNVQTAKHFGNLGRLYQSMKKFQVWLYVYVYVFVNVNAYSLSAERHEI